MLDGRHTVGDRIDRVAVCGRLVLHIGKSRKHGRQRGGLCHVRGAVQQLEVDIRSHDDHVVAQALARAVARDLDVKYIDVREKRKKNQLQKKKNKKKQKKQWNEKW